MIVSSAPAQTGSTDPTTSEKKEVMGKDDFLKLLVTQLQNQDPLEPLKSTDFAAQLAQFSSLEQMSNINKNLETMLLYQESMNNAQAVDLIGKEVKATGDSLSVSEGKVDPIDYTLSADAQTVTINIYDEDDKLIRSMDVGTQKAGDQEAVWDGKNIDGQTVADGAYRYEVLAKDAEGETVSATTYMQGVVTGVTFKDGVIYILVGDEKVLMGNVLEISGVPVTDTPAAKANKKS